MNYTRTITDAYLLTHVPYTREPVVSLLLSTDVLLVNSPEMTVISHHLPDLLLSGAGRYSRAEFLDAFNKLGANISISFDCGRLNITLDAPATTLKKTLALVTLTLTEPTAAKKEIDRIRTNVINALALYKEEAREIANDHMVNEFYAPKDRRHRHEPTITEATITQLRRHQLTTVLAALPRSVWTATLGGSDAAREQVVAFLDTITVGGPARAPLPPATTHLPHQQITFTHIPSKHNIEFSIGAALPFTIHHPDFAPFAFGLDVLGKWGGFTGRLMSTVREKEGLTYSIYARPHFLTGDHTGHWRIMTFFSPPDAERGITSTFREITAWATTGITVDEFKRFKIIFNTQRHLVQDSLRRTVRDLHSFALLDFTLDARLEFLERFQTITRDEINATIRTYAAHQAYVVSGAGPTKAVHKTLSDTIARVML